jgi:predicted TIM-barrel fold metal-dependent hydrolase
MRSAATKLGLALLLASLVSLPAPAQDGAAAWRNQPTTLKHERASLEQQWKNRIQSFLDKGVIPLIDLESTLPEDDAERLLEPAMRRMDELGFALIGFDGEQRSPGKSKAEQGHRWSDYTLQIANAYPAYFIPTTNGGTSKNWREQKDSFISQLEEQAKTGQYALIGELEFRHYLSSSECKEKRTERETDIPLTSANGHRLFRLSEQTGLPFVIHLEPEDRPLADLETMLAHYPKAKVIVAHFGQLRFPEKQQRFSPEFARKLFTTYPNVYYDLSIGEPGRRYPCNKNVLDTVIWEDSLTSQSDKLKPAYRAILAEFGDRFVAGTDYGNGRKPLPDFLKDRAENLRRIMKQLPLEAQHNIGYRNAWRLLTGKPWSADVPNKP